jgi:hypothetical protein
MYPRVSWVIEGDIVGCFDNLDHKGNGQNDVKMHAKAEVSVFQYPTVSLG